MVGIGEDGLDGLSSVQRKLIEGAELLVGGERHLAMVSDDGRQRLVWPKPLSDAFPELQKWRGRKVCVLASGDPMLFGVGVMLSKTFPVEEMTVLPGHSAFSLAAARLGWGLMDCSLVTLHGRALENLEAHIHPGERLLILSWDGKTPQKVAQMLTARGFGESRMIVLEAMGGPKERRVKATAEAWPHEPSADLNSIAVECLAGPEAKIFPLAPGLEDAAFKHDGQLTKREVRAVTLSRLMPGPSQCLWDVGAGAGSVAIEWMRSAPRTRAYAIEKSAQRCGLIAENAAALGVPGLNLIEGSAPDALASLSQPDAIFIGGGLTNENLLGRCWSALPVGGRLVANAVTIEGEAELKACHDRWGGEMTRLAVSRMEGIGAFRAWRPLMPVTLYAVRKS
ncbi:MAG: precorrin-6y C5,15-methyltransferase (decarboxylating) subunit CbiE [Kiloniellales bacterium]|nr:precorrin-6y C5,15-methyltransferase (decarboxylating) subunit CbiE [Kiloniellales bacterium]